MANLQERLESFATQFPLHRYQAKEVIINAQEEPAGIYWLANGKVRQSIISKEGEELSVHLFEARSFLPLTWALNKIPNRHSFEATEPTELHLVPTNEFIQFLQHDPEILFDLTQRLLNGLNGLLLRVESLSLQSANKRVASALIYLAKHFGDNQGNSTSVQMKLTHKEIATYTGLARETTSVEISKLERQGFISYHGSTLVIDDINKLKSLSD